MTHRQSTSAAAVLIALALGPTSTFAQGVQTGIITGTVTSEDGLSLPGATVTVTAPTLQGARSAVTDVNGNYVIRGLPPGDYEASIEMSGMRPRKEQTVVALGRTTTVDARLSLAGVAEAVQVVAQASPVVESPIVGANYRKEEIDRLPAGRTPQEIAELAPGLTDNTPNAGQLSISGGFAFDNVFLIDGVDVNDNFFADVTDVFIEDAVDETQVLTSGISAEYGRFSGGVVNLVTKRGGNQFSGSFRTNFSNPAWTDETPFETTDRRDDPQQVYEGTLGGPSFATRSGSLPRDAGRRARRRSTSASRRCPDQRAWRIGAIEGKVTATPFANHTFQGSFVDNDTRQTGVRGINASAIDPRVLYTRRLPQSLGVVNWNGVLTSKLFATAQWSQKKFAFKDNGGRGTVAARLAVPDGRRRRHTPEPAVQRAVLRLQRPGGSGQPATDRQPVVLPLDRPPRQPRSQGRDRELHEHQHRRQLAELDRLRLLVELHPGCRRPAALQCGRHPHAALRAGRFLAVQLDRQPRRGNQHPHHVFLRAGPLGGLQAPDIRSGHAV